MNDNALDRKIRNIQRRFDRKHSSAFKDYLNEALKGRFPVKETLPDRDDCPIAVTIGMMNSRRGTSKVCRLQNSCHRHDKGKHPECGKPPNRIPRSKKPRGK